MFTRSLPPLGPFLDGKSRASACYARTASAAQCTLSEEMDIGGARPARRLDNRSSSG